MRVTFSQGGNIDEATNDIRGAVGRIAGRLPEEADEPQVFKNDADADPIMRIAIVSSRLTAAETTDYAERFIIDRLATLDGVASVELSGARRYAMRISLDPKALAARRLTVADVAEALRRQTMLSCLRERSIRPIGGSSCARQHGSTHPKSLQTLCCASLMARRCAWRCRQG